MVYEAAALAPPFTAKNQVALAVKINEGSFSRIPAKYSDALMECISWMLTKQRELRPRTQDLLDKVGRWVLKRPDNYLVNKNSVR